MTGRQDYATAVRTATRELGRCVDELRRNEPDSPDLRRLVVDVTRVAEDLELLFGREAAAGGVTREVIPDSDYPLDFFADAEDEGVGRRR